MNSYLSEVLEGKIDFEGQRLVERLMYFVMISTTIISFIIGFALQSLRVTFGIFGVSVMALALVTIPPWPIFNSHPVKWLPAVEKKKS